MVVSMAGSSANTDSTRSKGRRSKPEKGNSRFGSAFRKVGSYLKEQADQQSHSALYLSPQTRRPHASTRGAERSLTDAEADAEHDLVAKLTALNGTTSPISYWQHTATSSTAYTPSPRSSASMTESNGDGPSMTRHKYNTENHLQTYDVHIPQRTVPSNGYWLVYIHGGYFRDPKVDSTSLVPTIKILEQNDAAAHIKAYASLDYRLSPHTSYPQNENTPHYDFNDAYWPNQPEDIIAAMQHLQKTYPESKRYVLVGHSVGAELAFIAALQASSHGIAAPAAMLGVCGIYDFPAIHASNPGYDSLTKNAMRPEDYKSASPACYSLDKYEKIWNGEKILVVLAAGKADELVVWDQVEIMENLLKPSKTIETEVIEVYGKHNEVWETGTELARAIQHTLKRMAKT